MAGRAAILVAAAFAVVGCEIAPEPLTVEEHRARAQQDLSAMFADVEPINGPIDLYEAMARAIRYNLDRREELLNTVVSQRTLDLVTLDMLPELSIEAGFNQRSNENASSSESIETGVESLEPSFSEDTGIATAGLTFSWNILDFGVSYFRARQQADRVLIAEEQRRRVVHTIIQDVRLAYWRAVAAQRLSGRIDPLIARVRVALDNARQLEEQRLQPPLEALEFQRTLLNTLDQLTTLQRELVGSKAQLAALMNLPPGQDYEVVVPDEAEMFDLPEIGLTPTEMEQVALINRPEVREESYQARIAQLETRRVMLSMLPGLSFDGGLNISSNSFLVNSNWATGGVNLTWNLVNLIQGHNNVRLAEANIELADARRLALSMAVLAQVNVSYLRFEQALSEFDSAFQLWDVESRIREATVSRAQTAAIGELDVIQAEVAAVVSELRRDAAYAGVHNAYGAMLVSIGADPLPEEVGDFSLETLSAGIRQAISTWEDGDLPLLLPEDAPADPATEQSEGVPITDTVDPAAPQGTPVGEADVTTDGPATPMPETAVGDARGLAFDDLLGIEASEAPVTPASGFDDSVLMAGAAG